LDSNIKIKFWGVRGSTPCANPDNMRYGGNTSCIQIFIDGVDEYLIADCGTGFKNLGNEMYLYEEALIGKVFITHPHWDHLQGFPFFKPFYDSKNSFEIYMPPQHEVGCKELLQGHLANTFFPVSIEMLESEVEYFTFEKGELFFKNYSVDFMWANHTIPTAIFKFTIGEKVIVFAPDNELPMTPSAENEIYLKEFKDFVTGADILIHDAQFTTEEHESRLGWGHSAWETVIQTTKNLGIKRLYLTHHDPDHTDEELDIIKAGVAVLKGDFYDEAILMVEGQVINLPI